METFHRSKDCSMVQTFLYAGSTFAVEMVIKKKHGFYIRSLNRKVIVIIQLNKRWTDRSQCTPNSNKMVSHMLHHNGDVMHICSECKISFRCAELRSHMVTHSKCRAYNCVQCQKSFGQAGNLKMHMLTHSNEKAYTCVQCQKSFGRADVLKGHMIIHSKERPHACVQCNKSFGQAGSLRRHLMITHTKEKPHAYMTRCQI